VEDTKIYTGCEFVYSSYDNGNDVAYYMCHDQINALLMEHVTRDDDYNAILGCQDNSIRVMSGSDIISTIATQAPVTALSSMFGDDSKILRQMSSIVYGTNTGTISNILLSNTGAVQGSQWSIIDEQKSSIKCMKLYDITQDGFNEIIAARNDGRVDVYTFDSATKSPWKAFSRNIGKCSDLMDTCTTSV
jgi:Bardet-Biedl syndrome 7 protein